jgi:gliding motility-associated-like protein/uncharacterized repeat protein (TIGR01451 family)
VSNQATAEGDDPQGNPVTGTSDDPTTAPTGDPTVITTPQNPAMEVTKVGTFNDANGNGYADVGETITYTITVTNTGNVTLSNIIVTDPNATITGGSPIATLAPGASATVTAEHVITQADINNGQVTNQATAEGDDPQGNPVTGTSDDPTTAPTGDPTVVTFSSNPEMTVTKTGTLNDANGNGYADAGETMDYTITVENTGNVPITNVTVNDPLIPTVTYQSGDTNNNGVLDIGETWVYTGSYTVTQADIDNGSITNQATANGDDPQGNTVSEDSDDPTTPTPTDPTVTQITQNPGISLEKTATLDDVNGNGMLDAGETITYTFTVTNTGNVTVTGITIDDPLGTVTGGPIDLAPGQTDNTSFTMVYTVTQADIDNGSVTNQATANGTDPQGNPVTAVSDDPATTAPGDPTVTQIPQHGAISVEKTGVFNDENHDGFAQEGETITYTFAVTNTGNVTVTGIMISDPLGQVQGGPVDLQPGETDSSTFTMVYTITTDDIKNGEVINQAVGTGVDASGNTVEDTSDDPNNPDDEDLNGDGDPDDATVTGVPGLIIYEVFTPNEDGTNDTWHLDGIENFDHNVKVFNRWGNLVFETDHFDNVKGWDGKSNVNMVIQSEKYLPAGTYYYIITLKDINKTFTGYIEILK